MLEEVKSDFFVMRVWDGQGVGGGSGSREEKDLRRNSQQGAGNELRRGGKREG